MSIDQDLSRSRAQLAVSVAEAVDADIEPGVGSQAASQQLQGPRRDDPRVPKVPDDEGFPTFSPVETALRMRHVTTTVTAAAAPPRGPRIPISVALMLIAVVSALVSIAVHATVLTSMPLFVAVNTAVLSLLVTLGLYLVLKDQERFTGITFAIAGLGWITNSFDIYPGWGTYIAYILGPGPLFYTTIGWGVFRYGRRQLDTLAERLFIPVSIFCCLGPSAASASLSRPEWLGLPADVSWLTVWPNRSAAEISLVVAEVCYIGLCYYFVALLVKGLRDRPPIGRAAFRPLAQFGSALAVGSVAIFTLANFAPDLMPSHTIVELVGTLTIGLTSALVTALVRRQLLGARFIERLPEIRTPESVSTYIKEMLEDKSAELLFWAAETETLIDDNGRRRVLADEIRPDRFYDWIFDSGGSKIALLTGHPLLRKDPTALRSLGRVAGIIAENARLHALLRMRVAQLTATRTAESLAFDKAREEFHRNLHDGLQQTVAAVRIDLDGLRDIVTSTDGIAVVDELEAKLGLALEQVHSLKKGTVPPELRFGLKPATDRAIAELRLNATAVISDDDLGILTLPIYYLVREGLTNIHKHAEAKSASVHVATDGRTVEIVIRDDGRGGASETERGGISGMCRRVEELGGALDVRSPHGGGTTLLVSIPCVSS